MKFYLMRHGLTEYNKLGLIQGGLSDIKLAKEGIEQANSVKDIINSLNINHVYSGELSRQIDTARIAASDLKDVDFNVLANFNEIRFGEFEGVHCDKAFPIANERVGTNLKGFHIDDPIEIGDTFKKADTTGKAENSDEAADRFLKGIQILENYYHDDGNILIVSSGMAIGTFFCKHCNRLSEYSMKNCSIHSVEKVNDQYMAQCIFKGVNTL